LSDGVRFYTEAFGFSKVSEPFPGVVLLRAGACEICLLEKEAGTTPAAGTSDRRAYQRHWTPVHLDFHVADLDAALAQAVSAGAKQEGLFRNPGYPGVAFCSDPFGHGFCLIENRP
jgi:predicted enzyme related to lactoylglutathione lyase